ncbi:hypothetical protein [Paraglaciecola sp. L3A3]|uniref:hypothetical protein n=1 Tax=Paraglaciecola sp. L3A3 TaxID=2686358 RepID=UPI00131DDFFB|nr:hypothetical protein [Paraglaciecola sp. L3A3]
MLRIHQFISVSCLVLLSSWTPLLQAETTDKLQFSGFARVVLGYLDEKNATYLGYDDNLSLSQQSLIGLQADYQILDNLSATGQFIGHSGNERESGVEWLYLTYKPSDSTQIRVGKQRTPLFYYSDSIDVGFAYPWVTIPQQVYKSVFFSTFEGVLANYNWSGKKIGVEVEAYWGSVDDTIYNAGVEVEANVNDLRGLIAKINYDNWAFRSAYHTAETFIGLTELLDFAGILEQFGFYQNAEFLNPNGKIDFYQLAASYDNLDYFFRAEATRTLGESAVIPDVDSYFVVVGYNYYPFLSYLSFGKSSSSYEEPVNEIPVGIDPQLDGLALGYQTIFNSLPALSSESITLGTRWDWKTNLAFKAEVTWVKGALGTSSQFIVLDEGKFDGKAPLYQLALEWVF